MKKIESKICDFCLGSKFVRFTPILKKGKRLPERGCPKCNGVGLLTEEKK